MADRQAAVAHLRNSDPVLGSVIDDFGVEALRDRRSERPSEHYGALVRSIVGQQVSTHAARAIYGRLAERFAGRAPTPAEVLADDPSDLRAAAGLSRAKVVYLRALAESVVEGSLDLEGLDSLDDDAVVAELTAVKGIGVWSAQIFLMFHLGRPDVLPVGDLGIRKAARDLYRLELLPDPETLTRVAEPWRPYRTLACEFLWHSLHNEPDFAAGD